MNCIYFFANRAHSIGRCNNPGRLQRLVGRTATSIGATGCRWCLGSLILGQHKNLSLLSLCYVRSRGVIFQCRTDWQVRRSFQSRCQQLLILMKLSILFKWTILIDQKDPKYLLRYFAILIGTSWRLWHLLHQCVMMYCLFGLIVTLY